MKRISTPLLAIACFFLALGFACNQNPENRQAAGTNNNDPEATTGKAELSNEELLAKGEHLVITSGCDDCHSPKKYKDGMPEPDMDKRLSGHPADLKLKPYDANTVKNGWVMTNEHFTAWVGPWGTSFASNISSDPDTGIGAWSEEQFSRALREGKFHGAEDGRMLLPPMPWPNFAKFTDEELRAIFTFLKATKPIKNAVPAPVPPKGA